MTNRSTASFSQHRVSADEYVEQLEEAQEFLQVTGRKPQVAIILGSGLGDFGAELANREVIPYTEIPHFPPCTVPGHRGNLIFGTVDGIQVAAFQGRWHMYEGHWPARAVFGIRAVHRLGIEGMIVTNAAGSLRNKLAPGSIMLIRNHISLFCPDPAEGLAHPVLGPQFYEQTEPYDQILTDALQIQLTLIGIAPQEGVFAYVRGPRYESKADVKALSLLGADAVGMSTVPEVLAMRQAGLKKILGLSLITNFAAGISDSRPSHEEVLHTSQSAKDRLTLALKEALSVLITGERF